ncbi:MAG TPA: hypothetical protein VGQ23_03715 [Burkholderiaceae bacterium]|jgi:hypothetical protein|nr:hypothetical protein [Burkholderiaceae bacterium]
MTRTRAIGWVAALAALAAVFAAYLRPDMVFALATQLWNCF